MTKRILQIIPTLDRAGAEKQLTLLATNLPKDRFDVRVCALTRSGPYHDQLEKHNVPVTTIGKRGKFDPRAYLRLSRYIRQTQPDIVQTWLFAAGAYGRVAALRAGTRRLLTTEVAVNPHKPWHEWTIDRRLAHSTMRLVAVSAAVKDYLVRGGLPEDKIDVILSGVPELTETVQDREELRRELGLPGATRLVATVGRLSLEKQLKDAIWATELLKGIRDDLHLLIIGDGPQRRNLQLFRDQVQLKDRVHFLGHRDDVPSFLPALDALWLTSAHEGLPNAVMEAMAAGLPIVATDIAANRELISHDREGFLVPVGDCAALARHTEKLLADAAIARRLGAAAQKRATSQLTVSRMVEQFASLYDEIMS